MFFDDLPPLRDQCRFDAVRIRDEAFQIRREVQQHELGIQFKTEGITEGGLDGEAAEIVRRTAQAPEQDGKRC